MSMEVYKSETEYETIQLLHKWVVPNPKDYKCDSYSCTFHSNKIYAPKYGFWFQLRLNSSGSLSITSGSDFELRNESYYLVRITEINTKKNLLNGRSSVLINLNLDILSLNSNFPIVRLECQITIKVPKTSNITQLKLPKYQLLEQIGDLFNTDEYADVTIVTRDKREIPAHKLILSVCSKVFAAMFKHPMEESRTNRIDIEDFNHEVMQELLRFIYTGDAPNLKDMPEDLLAAAEKYDIEALKKMCLHFLSDTLSIQNATKMFNLAIIYNDEDFLLKTAAFIKRNFAAVTETPDWQSTLDGNISLLLKSVCDLK